MISINQRYTETRHNQRIVVQRSHSSQGFFGQVVDTQTLPDPRWLRPPNQHQNGRRLIRAAALRQVNGRSLLRAAALSQDGIYRQDASHAAVRITLKDTAHGGVPNAHCAAK